MHLYIQFGSQDIRRYAEKKGYLEIFAQAGAETVDPSCGACIKAGPGVSDAPGQVTVSAINRNFPGAAGPARCISRARSSSRRAPLRDASRAQRSCEIVSQAIAPNSWVVLDYVLEGEDGEVLDESTGEGGEPIRYVHGYGMLVPGLEKRLVGLEQRDGARVRGARRRGVWDLRPRAGH